MILLQCSIENFGILSRQDFTFDRGFNSILQKNGTGKSTLVGFIRVMFYGLLGDRKKELKDNDRRRFRPWQGGRFGGSLTFSVHGKTYRIERFFGNTKAGDSFLLRDAATGLISTDYTENIGFELFRMDAESFQRTLLIEQQAIETQVTSDIHAQIRPIADPIDIRNYAGADQMLKSELNRLDPSRKTGALYQKQEEISRLLLKSRKPSPDQERLLLLEDRLFGASAGNLTKAEKQNEAARRLNRLQKRFPDGMPDMTALSKKREQLHQLTAEDPPPSLFARIFPLGSLSAGLLLLLALLPTAAGSFLQNYIPKAVLLIAAFALILLAVLVFLRQSAQKQTGMKNMHTLGAAYDKLSSLEADLLQYDQLMEYESLQDREEKRLLHLSDEKNRLEKEYKDLHHRYEVLLATRKYLQKAAENFSTSLRAPLLDSFSRFFRSLTKTDEPAFHLDANLHLSFQSLGSLRPLDALSEGMHDLAGLCFRLALIDAIYPEEKPFLILDDPFVNLDEEKIQAGMDLLTDLSDSFQILYFTCHESRC